MTFFFDMWRFTYALHALFYVCPEEKHEQKKIRTFERTREFRRYE